MKPRMRLADAVEWFIHVRSQTCKSDPGAYRQVAKLLSRRLKREATVQDLNRETIVPMMRALLKVRSQATVKTYATRIVTLWRWCESVGLTDEPAAKAPELSSVGYSRPRRTREKPNHQRRSQKELVDWLLG